jgi:NAD(P)H-dependent FMN reductase
VKLLGVSASLTKGGRTRAAVECALAAVAGRQPGVETELLDFRELAIAPCDGRPLEEYPADTRRAVQAIQDAAACLVSTPIYRGSYPGVLKNLLDITPLEALMGKPVGVIAVGGSEHHYLTIDQELRPLLAWFNAVVAPGSVYVQGADFQGAELTGARVRDDLRQLAEGVLELAARLEGCRLGPPPLAARTRG